MPGRELASELRGTQYQGYWVQEGTMAQGAAFTREPNSGDRRRSSRLRLQIPIFVRGLGVHEEEFLDLTKTINISAVGACLASPRPLGLHQLVSLCIPLPSPPSPDAVPEALPAIGARVIRCHAVGDLHYVGLDFVTPLD
jgi:hypothetical protein